MSYDCKGWATKYNVKCIDGRTIRDGAFAHMDGAEVPIVWNHQHNDPSKILGLATLEHRAGEGMYAYLSFNGSNGAKDAKEAVKHGEIKAMSIWANGLRETPQRDVLHGEIREVSLVLAGANPGARIEHVMIHSADGDFEDDETAIIVMPSVSGIIMHSDETPKEEPKEEPEKPAEEDPKEEPEAQQDDNLEHADKKRSVEDVIATMNEEQQEVMFGLIGMAREAAADEEGGKSDMKHNAFYKNDSGELIHGALPEDLIADTFKDAKTIGSLKESVLAHGIEQVDWLFPDFHNVDKIPPFVTRPMEWVSSVLNGIRRSPFSRIRSMFADLREEDARAKGYIKGKQKKEQVFTLLKRTTDPQTVYKLQKMYRDDIIDIVDFDVVVWIKTEMRLMLDEEIARAILIGDGRDTSSEDHISHDHIRPIAYDDDFYTIKSTIDTTDNTSEAELAKMFIRTAVKSRINYRGSGSPTLFTTEAMLIEMMLLEDMNGRIIYDTEDKLRSALRVSKIVTVPVMEGVKGKNEGDLLGIIVNLNDYALGADKGGAVNLFDDFDIDYNKYSYLIETRCSGALVVPYSAIAIEAKKAA